MMYLELFWAFFQVGLFSIGGGYAAIPLIQNQIVQLHGWLTMTEFADVITISQMTPGPIAINSATFVGIRIAGLGGALVATLGCIVPSCAIVLLFAALYRRYRNLALVQGVLSSLHPAVAGLIAAAGVSMFSHALWAGVVPIAVNSTNWIAVGLIGGCLILLRRFHWNPIGVMLLAGALGGVLYAL